MTTIQILFDKLWRVLSIRICIFPSLAVRWMFAFVRCADKTNFQIFSFGFFLAVEPLIGKIFAWLNRDIYIKHTTRGANRQTDNQMRLSKSTMQWWLINFFLAEREWKVSRRENPLTRQTGQIMQINGEQVFIFRKSITSIVLGEK